MRTFTHDGLEFQYLERGPADGEPVVLLHGFPEDAGAWLPVMDRLASGGHRVLALNQRGYSPGAVPRGFRHYRLSRLVADVAALIETVLTGEGGGTRVHLAGHDVGAVVAWNLAVTHPHLLRSLTIVSTPHPRALARAFLTSDQALRSWYIWFFQLPVLPERVLRANDGAVFVRLLRRTGLSLPSARHYTRRLLDTPGALTGAVNWYRAFLLTPGRSLGAALVTTPTQYVWSTGDSPLGRTGAELTGRYVTGPYDFRILDGVSHWIPEEAPQELADLIAAHARQHAGTPE